METTRSVLLLAVLTVASGCTSSITCPAVAITAIEVRVKNAQTNEFIASGATLTGRFNGVEGLIAEHPSGPGADTLPIIVAGSAGTYDVRVRRAGFADFVQNGIVVPGINRCDQPQKVAITANLVPTL